MTQTDPSIFVPMAKGARLGLQDSVVVDRSADGVWAFAEYVAVKAETLIPKPAGIDFEKAAGLPYVFSTAWSALSKDGELTEVNAAGKRIFVQGGVGGVGSMAIQVAKYLGAEVIATGQIIATI